MGNNSKNEPYSYHTFILPFIWHGKKDSYNRFVKYFDDNEFWSCSDMKNASDINSNSMISTKEDRILLYKEYQYFHPFARKAIYGFGEGIVHNYEFLHEKVYEKAHYYIQKCGRTYDLLINTIRLKIFNTGVALFIIETMNYGYDKDGKPQNTFGDVKNINDYGRRISLPIISEPNLCADSIKVEIGDMVFEDNFREHINQVSELDDISSEKISLTHMCDFVKSILGYGGDYTFTSRETIGDKEFYVYPILDDRMYVISSVKDSEAIGKCCEDDSKSIYEYVYVDNEGNCSCQNKKMRKEMLDKALYERWTDYGTRYYITDYSFMLLGDNGLPGYIIESFLTQYYQMACLVIAQRASLMKFKREITTMALGLEKTGKRVKVSSINKIMDLQERFVAFESQLYFDEVSSEQQGIEMYDKLVDQSMIRKEMESLRNQLDAMYNISDTSLGFRINRIMLIFTWVSGILAFAALVISTMQIQGFKDMPVLKILNTHSVSDYSGTTVDGTGVGIIVMWFIILSILGSLMATAIILIRYRRKR